MDRWETERWILNIRSEYQNLALPIPPFFQSEALTYLRL
jgi:hypothetical protein